MRRPIALLVLVAACSSSSPAPDPPSTTVPGAVAASMDRILTTPTEDVITEAARAAAASGDLAWTPYLVDLVRLVGGAEAFTAIREALTVLSGVAPPDDAGDVYAAFGEWLYDAAVVPGEHYEAWKPALYGLLDPGFEDLLAQVDDRLLLSRIQWGGVVRGGIPELNSEPVAAPAELAYMTPDELTFGVVVGGEARAYPHRILNHHELANDVIAGTPVALVNCTLCRTGVLYSRRAGDRVLSFETSGLLFNSNKVMVDRETESLWYQLTGEAFAGPLAGTVLDRFPITVTTYGRWLEEHPDTGVLPRPGPGYGYSYEPGDAYRAYYETERLWFPAFGNSRAAKTEVGTLVVEGSALAVDVAALEGAGIQVFDIAITRVAAVPTAGGVRFYDLGDADIGTVVEASEDALRTARGVHPRLVSGHSFWFAWVGSHPDTAVWPTET